MSKPMVSEEGTHLIHIGFRKCGTTALQLALHRARGRLLEAGVLYPGSDGNHTPAALAVTGRTHGWASIGAKPQPMTTWDALVSEVAAAGARQRVIVSSEFFDVADEATIRTVIAGLGGDRARVVATARPLSKVLPSAWQQQVKAGSRHSYGQFLKAVLDAAGTSKTHRTFWERHDQAAVLARWASVLGPDRVTLVVLDDDDRNLPYRSFETMLGLPEGTLQEVSSQSNRSMTGAETELIRQINREIFSHDITWAEYTAWIGRGAALRLVRQRTPDPQEPRTRTPVWALERATQISTGFVSGIEGLGIEVVGDLAGLAAPAATGTDEPDNEPSVVPIEAAVQAVLGTAFGSRRVAPKAKPPPPPPRAPEPGELPGRELARLLGERLQRRLRRAWRRRTRGRPAPTTSA